MINVNIGEIMRKDGNPDLEKYQYQCTIAEKPAEPFSIRLPPGSTELLIKKFGKKEYRDVIRQAIAKLIED